MQTEEHNAAAFQAGVIEGFYGVPWTQEERFQLFDWMAAWGLNTYVYAPKDDLKHRTLWRERHSKGKAENLAKLISACAERGIRFVYALSPGLDIRYANVSDSNCLKSRFEQLLELGTGNFALLFDDIPGQMDPADLERFGSLAAAQSSVTNDLFKWARERRPDARLFFCPTAYCGRMAERKVGGDHYLGTVGRELLPEIEVFWTGPEIVSQKITLDEAREMQALLRRKPVIWDNLHANDYDARRFFCGPFSGRTTELRRFVNGLLINPNCELPLNYVPLRTLAEWVKCKGGWNARRNYLSALRDWLPFFEMVGEPVALEDLVLFADCFYLPHEAGAEAEALCQSLPELLSRDPAEWKGDLATARDRLAALRDFCTRLPGLRHRALFHALHRQVWELREELDLIDRYLTFRSAPENRGLPFASDFHLPGTFRGGMVARLQQLLTQQADGTFTARRKDGG